MARSFCRKLTNSSPVQKNGWKTWTGKLLDTLLVVKVCRRSVKLPVDTAKSDPWPGRWQYSNKWTDTSTKGRLWPAQRDAFDHLMLTLKLHNNWLLQWLVHWPLMGGLLHLVQRGGAWAGCGPAQSPHRCTKCNSPPINSQCTNFVLFDVTL